VLGYFFLNKRLDSHSVILLCSLSITGLRGFCIAAETTTPDGNSAVTSEAEGTPVTVAANDAVTSSSVGGVISSSLPRVLGKLHLHSNPLSVRKYLK